MLTNFIYNWWKWIVGLFIPVALAATITPIADSQINPYTDKVDRLAISRMSSIPDAGLVETELVKARPEIRLKKWNGEVNLGIRYDGIQASGNRSLLTNRMEWKDAKREVHAYPLDAKEGMEDGGFEIEIVLTEKPATNKFDFTIDGAENLDFFYQPALSQQEIDEGASRPENVVNSFAVYYSKSNHITGQVNYATGKFLHIYRPKITDANGNWIWGELSYDNAGTLSITIDKEWLNTAVYPVIF